MDEKNFTEFWVGVPSGLSSLDEISKGIPDTGTPMKAAAWSASIRPGKTTHVQDLVRLNHRVTPLRDNGRSRNHSEAKRNRTSHLINLPKWPRRSTGADEPVVAPNKARFTDPQVDVWRIHRIAFSCTSNRAQLSNAVNIKSIITDA